MGSHTAADVLAGRKVLENMPWAGEQGAWAPFRTAQLPRRHDTPAAPRGVPRRPSCLQLGGAVPALPGLGSTIGSSERAGKPSPLGRKKKMGFLLGSEQAPAGRDNGC